MRIANIELTKDRLMIAGAVAVAAVVLLVYLTLFAPLTQKLGIKHRECRACENDVIYARNTIKDAGRLYGDRALMTEKEVSVAIDELTKHGKDIGINFISMTPREIVHEKGAKYKTLPIEMEIEAEDQKFAEFLGSLDELKRALIKVKSFDIIPNPEDRKKLKAVLVVDMYLSGGEYGE